MKKLFYFLSISIFFLAASCSDDEPDDFRSDVLHPGHPTRTGRVYKTTNPQRHRVEDSEAQEAIFIQTKDNME